VGRKRDIGAIMSRCAINQNVSSICVCMRLVHAARVCAICRDMGLRMFLLGHICDLLDALRVTDNHATIWKICDAVLFDVKRTIIHCSIVNGKTRFVTMQIRVRSLIARLATSFANVMSKVKPVTTFINQSDDIRKNIENALLLLFDVLSDVSERTPNTVVINLDDDIQSDNDIPEGDAWSQFFANSDDPISD
jgi:hypothetical protein